jgi:hypothetical protein
VKAATEHVRGRDFLPGAVRAPTPGAVRGRVSADVYGELYGTRNRDGKGVWTKEAIDTVNERDPWMVVFVQRDTDWRGERVCGGVKVPICCVPR